MPLVECPNCGGSGRRPLPGTGDKTWVDCPRQIWVDDPTPKVPVRNVSPDPIDFDLPADRPTSVFADGVFAWLAEKIPKWVRWSVCGACGIFGAFLMGSQGYTGYGLIVGAAAGVIFLPAAIAITAAIVEMAVILTFGIINIVLAVAIGFACLFILAWVLGIS